MSYESKIAAMLVGGLLVIGAPTVVSLQLVGTMMPGLLLSLLIAVICAMAGFTFMDRLRVEVGRLRRVLIDTDARDTYFPILNQLHPHVLQTLFRQVETLPERQDVLSAEQVVGMLSEATRPLPVVEALDDACINELVDFMAEDNPRLSHKLMETLNRQATSL